MIEQVHMLMQLNRYPEAEEALRRELHKTPEESRLHSLLAFCLIHQERREEALEEAGAGIHYDPEDDYAFYVMAYIQFELDDYDASRGFIAEAIERDPCDPDYYALRSSLHANEQKWVEVLEDAEEGLQWDGEHETCNNFRVMALLKLGREDEAEQSLEAVLENDPDSSFTHANTGWTMLEGGQHEKALTHFQEALRLEPDNEWAREGVLSAMKSKNPLYRLMLKWVFWMNRFDAGKRNMIIFSMFIVVMLSDHIERMLPFLAPFMPWLILAYLVFALGTWLTEPFFDTILALTRDGRRILSPKQRKVALFFGPLFVISMIAVGAYLFTKNLFCFGLCILLVFQLMGIRGLSHAQSKSEYLFTSVCIGVASALIGVHLWHIAIGSIWFEFWFHPALITLIGFEVLTITHDRVGFFQTRTYFIKRYGYLALFVLGGIFIGWRNDRPAPDRHLTLGEETTRNTTPSTDGYVFYLQALNENQETVPDDENLIVQLARLSPDKTQLKDRHGELHRHPAYEQWENEAGLKWKSMTDIHALRDASIMREVKEDTISDKTRAYLNDWIESNDSVFDRLEELEELERCQAVFDLSRVKYNLMSPRSATLSFLMEVGIAAAAMEPSAERNNRLITCLKISRNLMNSPDPGHYLIGYTNLKLCQRTLFKDRNAIGMNQLMELRKIFESAPPPTKQIDETLRYACLMDLQERLRHRTLPAYLWKTSSLDRSMAVHPPDADALARQLNAEFDRLVEEVAKNDGKNLRTFLIDQLDQLSKSGKRTSMFSSARKRQAVGLEGARMAYLMTPHVYAVSIGMQMEGWKEESE